MRKNHALFIFLLFNTITSCENTPKLSSIANFTIGAIAGSTATVLLEPLIYLKNKLQQGTPLSKNFKHWYRGIFINGAGSIPSIALQNMVFQKVKNSLESTNLKPLHKDLICAISAGGVSSLLLCPRSLLTIHQQNEGGTIYTRIKTFIAQHGIRKLWRGLTPMGIMSCGFTGTLYATTPTLKAYIAKKSDHTKLQSLAPGILAGSSYAAITHPLDTIRTCMQAEITHKSSWQVAYEIFHDGIYDPRTQKIKKGFPAFYNGALPRIAGVSGTMLIVSVIKDYLTACYHKKTTATSTE